MSYRKLFIALNVGILAAFAYALWLDANPEWKKYQERYYDLAAQKLETDAKNTKDPAAAEKLKAEAEKMRNAPIAIRQILPEGLDRADRCTTCHVGMDPYANPAMGSQMPDAFKNVQPFASHPKLDLTYKNHDFTKYGCTACHRGQGLATTVADAHGDVPNWHDPMLRGKYIQASCVQCHNNFEHLKGAEFAAQGKQLFNKVGCVGCHSINGVGGVVSVDLGDISDKPLEHILGQSFALITQYAEKDGTPLKQTRSLPRQFWTTQNWILAHLTNDPESFVPNDPMAQFNAEPIAPSGMQDFRLADLPAKDNHDQVAEGLLTLDQAESIATYLLSRTAEDVPSRYHVDGPPDREPKFADAAGHGKYVFQKYGCAGCHGFLGQRGRRNYNALGEGQGSLQDDLTALGKGDSKPLLADMAKGREPTLVDVVGTYSHDELVKKIANGVAASAINRFNPTGPVPPLYMPAWKDKIKPQEMDDLATWLLTIAKTPAGQGGF